MFNRIARSIPFRIASVYQWLLARSNHRFITSEHDSEIDILLLCGKNQLEMLRQCLTSINKVFGLKQRFHIFLDDGLDAKEVVDRIKWLPQDCISLITKKECVTYHKQQGNLSLATFAQNNPMGLKMAAIIQIANLGKPILYCDTDVLWHSDPATEIDKLLAQDDLNIVLSYDFQPAYDQNLIEKGHLHILKEEPFYCAGILFLKHLTSDDRELLNQLFEIVMENSNHFSEQTLFAYITKVNGNYGLDRKRFVISVEDQYQLFPVKDANLIARHYIGPVRHIFWRDAFFKNFDN